MDVVTVFGVRRQTEGRVGICVGLCFGLRSSFWVRVCLWLGILESFAELSLMCCYDGRLADYL